jgi:hypothetical protein
MQEAFFWDSVTLADDAVKKANIDSGIKEISDLEVSVDHAREFVRPTPAPSNLCFGF